MRGTRVAIDAPVLAAAIRVQADFKTNVRAVVVAQDRLGLIAKQPRRRRQILVGIPVVAAFEVNFFEPVRRIRHGSTTSDWNGIHGVARVHRGPVVSSDVLASVNRGIDQGGCTGLVWL